MKPPCLANTNELASSLKVNTTVIKSTVWGFHHPTKINFYMMNKLFFLTFLVLAIIFVDKTTSQHIGLPYSPNNVVHFTETHPGYVFDIIPFYWKREFHVFYLNGVFDNEGIRKGIKWCHAKTADFKSGDIFLEVLQGDVILKDFKINKPGL